MTHLFININKIRIPRKGIITLIPLYIKKGFKIKFADLRVYSAGKIEVIQFGL